MCIITCQGFGRSHIWAIVRYYVGRGRLREPTGPRARKGREPIWPNPITLCHIWSKARTFVDGLRRLILAWWALSGAFLGSEGTDRGLVRCRTDQQIGQAMILR